MNWYAVPGVIVAVVSIVKIVHSLVTADNLSGISKIIADIIKLALHSLRISLGVFVIEIILLYLFYWDFLHFYHEIVLRYSLYLYFFIFIDVFLILFFFPYLSNETTKVEKYGNQYLIQSKLTYGKNINVSIMYFVEKFKDIIGLKILTLLSKILLFSSILPLLIGGINVIQNVKIEDSKYPFIANEKTFIKNVKPVDIYEVKNKKIKKGTLPSGTKFSIAKGTNFSFNYDRLNSKQKGGKANIHNGIYGLSPSKKISLKKGSKLFFEDVVDYTIFVKDKYNNLSYYYTVKTVPGKTYIDSDSSEYYEVITNPEKKVKDTVYSFIVGYTKDDINYKEFLDNATSLNRNLMLLMLLLFVVILFIQRKYVYYMVCLIADSLIILGIIMLKGIPWISAILVILLLISLIEIFCYGNFLRNYILIKRRKSMSEVNIELLYPKPKIVFKGSGKEKIDVTFGGEECYYTEQLEYTILKGNKERITNEFRIIAYKRLKDILSEYIKNYSLFSFLNKSKYDD